MITKTIFNGGTEASGAAILLPDLFFPAVSSQWLSIIKKSVLKYF